MNMNKNKTSQGTPRREWSSKDYEDKFDSMENGSYFDAEEEAYAEANAYEKEAYANRNAQAFQGNEASEDAYESEAHRFAAAVDPDYVDPEFTAEDPDYGGGVYAPIERKTEVQQQQSYVEKELEIFDFSDSDGEERGLKTEFAEEYQPSSNDSLFEQTKIMPSIKRVSVDPSEAMQVGYADNTFQGEITYSEEDNPEYTGAYDQTGNGYYDQNGVVYQDENGYENQYGNDQNGGVYQDEVMYDQNGEAYEDQAGYNQNGIVYSNGNEEYDENVDDEILDEEVYADENLAYDDSEEFDEDDDAGLSFFHKVKYKLTHMSAIDWVITGTGAAVIVLLIIVGIVAFGKGKVDTSKETAALATIGQNMDGIGIIGENGMNQVTDLTVDRLTQAKNQSLEDLVQEAGSEKMAIMLNITTLDHDLKIKFVDAETNKMVSGYEFMAEVTDPKGKTQTYTDTDKDGMIHVEKLSAGSYSCKIVENPDIDPSLFVWSSLVVTTNVKDQMDYVKIDVSDEIKTAEEVVEAVEDVEEQEEATPVESTLTDTVEWVESTKTSIGSNSSYKEIKLTDIKEPTVAAANKVFMKTAEVQPLSGVSIEGGSDSYQQSDADIEVTFNAKPDPATGTYTYKWSVSGGTATSGDDGASYTVKFGSQPGDVTISLSVSDGTNTKDASKTIHVNAKQAEPSPTPTPTAVLTSANIAINGTAQVDKDKECTFSVTGVPEGNFTYAWSADNATITDGDKASCKIKFSGNSTVKVTVSNPQNAEDKVTKEFAVTVKTPIVATTETAAALSVAVGGEATFKSTATLTETAPVWKVKSSDESIAKVVTKEAGTATVTGVKAGTATITLTAETPEGTLLHTVTCAVTVTGEISASIDQANLSLASGKTADLTVTITNLPKDAKWTVTWASSDPTAATVAEKASNDANKKIGTVTGVDKLTASKKTTITATVVVTVGDKQVFTKGLSTTVTVTPAAAADTTSVLYTKDGAVVYKLVDGNYVKAVYADYYVEGMKFYVLNEKAEYKYTGWQTIDGNTYYFDKNGNKVTGDQVIMGAQYHFASDGALITGSGSLGIDVSKWNANINWSAVANSGVSFVIIRCGYRGASTGALVEDSKFKSNIKGATGAGLKVGVYFFSQAMTEGEAVEEASMCLSLVSGYRVSYPIFIDLESASNGRANGISSADRTKVALAFCRTITNAGYKAGVYANKTWLNSKMDAGSLGSYNIWLAQYAAQPSYKGKYNLWQYSSKGKINGITTDVDLDISYLGY